MKKNEEKKTDEYEDIRKKINWKNAKSSDYRKRNEVRIALECLINYALGSPSSPSKYSKEDIPVMTKTEKQIAKDYGMYLGVLED